MRQYLIHYRYRSIHLCLMVRISLDHAKNVEI